MDVFKPSSNILENVVKYAPLAWSVLNAVPSNLFGNVFSTRSAAKPRARQKYKYKKSGWKQSQRVKLRSIQYLNQAPAAQSTDVILHLNSAFDPFGAEAAEQPYGFDLYANMYKKYEVLGFKVKVTFIPYDSNGVSPIALSSSISTDSDAPTDWHDNAVRPYGQWRGMKGLQRDHIAGPTEYTMGADKSSINYKWIKCKSLVKGSYEKEEMQALTTAEPTTIIYGKYYARTVDGATVISDCVWLIEIVQDILFSDPKYVADA